MLLPGILFPQQQVKNVILLIPDGTSTDVLSLARWYQGDKPLAIDEIICGLVKTNSYDSTITDSAPASTAFATGNKTKSGYVGVKADNTPCISVLELARLKGLSTGIVVTCQFPHATPADFVCHYFNRDSYDVLARQFVYNSPDLVFGGGYAYLSNPGLKPVFDSLGYRMITDYQSFKNFNTKAALKKPTWALFDGWLDGKKYLSYDCDRDTTKEPSLSEMTDKAIQLLSQNKKGFFLMVEGSQVDWAAHNNDPKGVVTEFLAFDKAVKMAIDFAKKDKNTLVIVCPDHGNGGITMGSVYGDKSISFDKMNIPRNVIGPLKSAKHSSRWVYETILKKIDNQGNTLLNTSDFSKLIEQEYSIKLTDAETENLVSDLKLIKFPSTTSKISSTDLPGNLISYLGHTLSDKASIGWTTSGHTNEDVFLGIYHPKNDRLTGVVENSDIGNYIAKQLNLGNLEAETTKYFKAISSEENSNSYIIISKMPFRIKKGQDTYEISSNVSFFKKNNQLIPLNTLVLNKGTTYFVPEVLFDALIK